MEAFVHLGDLHLGIKFHKRSLIKDQTYVLNQILNWIQDNGANLIIAGDVFDTVNPPLDAQELWYTFLYNLGMYNKENGKHTYIMPGNHDSAVRLGLGNAFYEAFNIHILSPSVLYESFILDDGWKLVMVPFIKPSLLEAKVNIALDSYDEVFSEVVRMIDSDVGIDDKTILISHQTFEGATMGESEFKPFMPDAVNQCTVSRFKKVLAGHLHSRQSVGNITYSGSLLPYAFGDDYAKSFLCWYIDGCDIYPEVVDLDILHNLTTIEGDLAHCLSKASNQEDYIRIKLKNCVHFEEALAKLQKAFPLLCTISTDAMDTWEADLNKEVQAFTTVQEALDAFCNQLEIPTFEGKKKKLIQEALDAFTQNQN